MTASAPSSTVESPAVNFSEIPFTVYHGTFVHPRDLKHLDVIFHGSIGVDHSGTIVFVDRESHTSREALDKYLKDSGKEINQETAEFVEIDRETASFFFPGFFDTHIVSIYIYTKIAFTQHLVTNNCLLSMPPNTPTAVSLANLHFSTGWKHTPFL